MSSNERNQRPMNQRMSQEEAGSISRTQAGGGNKTGATRPAAPPGPLRKFIRTPKGSVLVLLLGLMVVGAIHASDRLGIENIIVAMATASVIDIVVGKARKNKRIFPDGGMITGLIIGLVLSSTVHWPVTALTAAIAVVSKHLFKIGRKPIFNPAAFALLFTLLVFHTGQSWWGDLADLPVLFLPLLLIAGYIITSRVNKWPQVLVYLGTYFLILTLAASLHLGNASFTPGDALRVPLVNAALFMSFFMLTDPPTSPGKYSEQVTFSVVAAVVSAAIYLEVGGLAYLLIGLLAANTWRAIALLSSSRANRAAAEASAASGGPKGKMQNEMFG
ncbi:RnfABCDGE type electron transport complex subunit D [Alicyclobacillus mengziensis]|uniref:RnfABCDGE type electron transport complex subunit D n=1 Tax=Alicyclobacillus mengziensis TaxID=2931921 RepID=A0A9X7VWD3_9BACL|nr:RnfABCDGE type electron transport complex subunit D [Alicyclobacillus mengziensis]QSO46303.1 RnfABCDGE type electron transport complex subunit D [Alicyclobacillus mengziensis]